MDQKLTNEDFFIYRPMNMIIRYIIYENDFRSISGLVYSRYQNFNIFYLILADSILRLKYKILEIVTKIFHIGIYSVLRISSPFLFMCMFTFMNPNVHFFFMLFTHMMQSILLMNEFFPTFMAF